jgi:Matrixin
MPKAKRAPGNWSIDDLAGQLINAWKNSSDSEVKSAWNNRNIGQGELAAGLAKLKLSRILDLELINDIADSDVRLKLALSAVKSFQRLAKVKPDGVFGRFTRGRVAKFFGCDEERKSKDQLRGEGLAAFQANTSTQSDHSEFLLRYHIAPELARFRPVGSERTGKELIAEARFAWIQHLNLVMRITDDPQEANIIMIWHNFDGPGGTLGDAHIGGRTTGQQLRLRFDENESWSEKMFLNTATHELGHILGLTHSSGDNMMSPFQEADRGAKLSPQDINDMRAIWGAA